MAEVIDRIQARYEVQKVEFGKVYRWCPESILIECSCGETTVLTSSTTICVECGEEHTGLVREALPKRRLKDRELHPWRYSKNSENDSVLWF